MADTIELPRNVTMGWKPGRDGRFILVTVMAPTTPYSSVPPVELVRFVFDREQAVLMRGCLAAWLSEKGE